MIIFIIFVVPLKFQLFYVTLLSGVPLTPRSVTSSTENTDSLPPVSSASSPPVSSASSTPTTSAELSSPAFHIPWSKMPANLMTSLAKKERPTPALRREMVRIICSDIVTTCANPGRRQLRLLADKIVDTYPLSFRDMLDGDVVGSGYDSLMLQLESRLDNLNRGKLSVKRRLSENSSESPESVQSTKICPRDYYGCISWQPILPSGDDLMDLKSKQAALKCLASEANPDMVLLKELMQQTYCLQRADINMGMNAAELQEAWPSLFTALGIATHFEQLTEIPLLATMTSAMDRKAATIVDFLKSSSKKCAPVLLRLDEAKAELGNNSPMVVGILLLLASHFGENADSLVLSRDVSIALLI